MLERLENIAKRFHELELEMSSEEIVTTNAYKNWSGTRLLSHLLKNMKIERHDRAVGCYQKMLNEDDLDDELREMGEVEIRELEETREKLNTQSS